MFSKIPSIQDFDKLQIGKRFAASITKMKIERTPLIKKKIII